jgi:hypothetical protein
VPFAAVRCRRNFKSRLVDDPIELPVHP